MENNINPANQSSNIPENISQPVSSSKTNPLILILLILFILLISAGAFALGKYYSTENKSEPVVLPTPIVQQPTTFPTALPTTDPTANWKTYTGNNYYFKYPSDWEVKNLLSTDQNLEWLKTTSIYLGIRPNTIGEDVLGNIRITSDSLQTVINDTKTQMLTPGSPTKLLSEKEINFNSDQATELIFENTIAKVKSRFIIISKAEKTYILSGGGIEDATLIDQILSSFRFLDNTQTTGTENWKTYTNTKYKYEFKCPLSSVHNIEITNGNGNTIPFYQEICYEGNNQVRIMVISQTEEKTFNSSIQKDLIPSNFIDKNNPQTNIATYELKSPNSKYVFYLRGFYKDYFDQIFFTFKFLE